MITALIFFTVILCTAAFFFGIHAVSRSNKTEKSRFSVNTTLEQIKEMGELTVMTAYVKEIVEMKDSDSGWHTRDSKMIVVCIFDIEFRYDLRRVKITRNQTGVISMTLPPHFVRTIPKGTNFYHEEEAKFLGVFSKNFSSEDRNRLLQEAQAKAIEQAGILRTELQEKVRASATTTLASIARGFGSPEVIFDFDDSSSAVHQIARPTEASAA